MNKRRKGAAHEQAAKVYLEKRGVRIQTINYRVRQGEIDIIGYDGTCLVFFEVKARDSLKSGYGAEAINLRKQYKICRVADFYRMKHGIGEFTRIRYDCVVIDKGEIAWIKNAFTHIWM